MLGLHSAGIKLSKNNEQAQIGIPLRMDENDLSIWKHRSSVSNISLVAVLTNKHRQYFIYLF